MCSSQTEYRHRPRLSPARCYHWRLKILNKKKYLYLFSEGNRDMRDILGGKGANLAEMTNAGMPVPQGFTISTEACTQYYKDGRQINHEIMADIYEYIGKMEDITGKKFGNVANPLLVSVRSGARASMPGMLPPFRSDVQRRGYGAAQV